MEFIYAYQTIQVVTAVVNSIRLDAYDKLTPEQRVAVAKFGSGLESKIDSLISKAIADAKAEAGDDETLKEFSELTVMAVLGRNLAKELERKGDADVLVSCCEHASVC